jgi:AP-3 complex subunit delta-1
VVALLGHQRAYVRKKALLALYKLFIKYPQGLRLCFDKIRERLEDSDKSVVSCAVSVICELADRNPKNYLALAPQFFKLLTTSSNNWMLIKVVKLLGSLVPEEPRLARKLLEPLSTIIQNTGAKSLLYECIHTVTLALPYTRKADGTDSRAVPAVVKLCSEHLHSFVEDPDQNLKYLGLVGLANLMDSHPRAVAEHRDLILACLDDEDVTIRARALDLLAGMVTKKSLEDLVHRLLKYVSQADGKYRDELIGKIIFMCSRDKYAFLTDFKWYMGVLVDVSKLIGEGLGSLIASQLTDVAMRVETVRDFTVESMLGILLSPEVHDRRALQSEVLGAAAWIVGEYSGYVKKLASRKRVAPALWRRLMRVLLSSEALQQTSTLQSTFVTSSFKLLVSACGPGGAGDDELSDILQELRGHLLPFRKSPYIEVQERASVMAALLSEYGVLPPDEPESHQHEGGGSEEDSSDEGDRSDNGHAGLQKNGVRAGRALSPMDLLGMEVGDGPIKDASLPAPAPSEGLACMLGGSGGSTLAIARSAAVSLKSLFAAELKPVNPKAQGKVPPPEGTDLSHPLNSAAINALLEEPESVPRDMSRVSFTQLFPSAPDQDSKGEFYDSYNEASSEMGSPTPLGGQSRRSPRVSRDAGDEDSYNPPDLFYLGQKDPVGREDREKNTRSEKKDSRLPDLEADDDYAGGLRRRRKHKKKHHRRQKEEAMPPGAELSSDDDLRVKHRSRHRGQDELSAIDITTPLGEDERFPELKHREVPVASAPSATSTGAEKLKGKDQKARKRKKKERHHLEHGLSPAAAGGLPPSPRDLLDFSAFEGGSSLGAAAVSSSHQTWESDLSNILGASAARSGVDSGMGELLGSSSGGAVAKKAKAKMKLSTETSEKKKKKKSKSDRRKKDPPPLLM